jgi:hypothetical protein
MSDEPLAYKLPSSAAAIPIFLRYFCQRGLAGANGLAQTPQSIGISEEFCWKLCNFQRILEFSHNAFVHLVWRSCNLTHLVTCPRYPLDWLIFFSDGSIDVNAWPAAAASSFAASLRRLASTVGRHTYAVATAPTATGGAAATATCRLDRVMQKGQLQPGRAEHTDTTPVSRRPWCMDASPFKCRRGTQLTPELCRLLCLHDSSVCSSWSGGARAQHVCLCLHCFAFCSPWAVRSPVQKFCTARGGCVCTDPCQTCRRDLSGQKIAERWASPAKRSTSWMTTDHTSCIQTKTDHHFIATWFISLDS